MKNIYDYQYDELQQLMVDNGFKAFNGRQIYRWLYKELVDNFDDMTDLSKTCRAFLKENFIIGPLEMVKKQVSKDGTRKYLFRLNDGSLVESVLMRFDYGNSICVTTQVGCNMGCKFCASGMLKKQRNLNASEIVQEVVSVAKDLNERVSHIVVMGTGEPFDNYDNLMQFLSIVNSDYGLGIGARHITISTCGVVPKILEFAKGRYQYNLAISLHAANNELRDQLMPINHAYPLEELMSALDVYEEYNNRRLTFEYILLKGVNDSKKDAEQLAKLLKNKHYYINLIPYNSVDEKDFRSVSFDETMVFYDYLCKLGIRATIRKEHGGDIDAACGQLRAKEIKKQKEG